MIWTGSDGTIKAVINQSIIVYTLRIKSFLPSLPLQKGGIPLFGKEGLGEIFG